MELASEVSCAFPSCSDRGFGVLTVSFILQVEAFTRDLEISNDALEKVMAILLVELNNGLQKATNPTADIKQYITYVRDVPDGSGKSNLFA